MKTYTMTMFNLMMFSLSNWFSYWFTASIMNKIPVYVLFPLILLFCFFSGYFVWGKLTDLFEEIIKDYED